MHTPNFDKFATEALVFDNAYTNFAICSPSRNSFMSGRAPDETRVWNFRQDFRQAGLSRGGVAGADWVTLPQYFKEAGYLTLGHGKIYHPGKPPKWDEPASWSQLQPYGPEHIAGCGKSAGNYCPHRGSAASFSDFNTTVEAIATLGRMEKFVRHNATPFFLGVGMHHPHQQWSTPTELAWLYAGATSGLPGVLHPSTPARAPDVALSAELDGQDHITLDWTSPDLANRTQDPELPPAAAGVQSFALPSPGNNTVPAYFAQYMRLGYYTAVTHSDAHFGMMMDALDASGLANDTLVVLFGDHGWSLQENSFVHTPKHGTP
jgi:iduronate 2-sulfatase